jgi:hypothetical protein
MTEKQSFATSQYSTPLNPIIASGASRLPPLRIPGLEAPLQKTAAEEPVWYADLREYFDGAEFLSKYATTNIGQWWEQVGGPHLAKGGTHADFQRMMNEAAIPEGVQKKFNSVAKAKYPEGHNLGRGARRASDAARGSAAARPGGNAAWNPTPAWENRPPPASLRTPANVGGGAVAAGLGAHMLFGKSKADPNEAPSRWKGRLGAYLGMGAPMAVSGMNLGHLRGGNRGAVAGGLAGLGLGALMGEGMLRGSDMLRLEDVPEEEKEELLRDAGRSSGALGRRNIIGDAIAPLITHALGGPELAEHAGLSAAGVMAGSYGKGMLERYIALKHAPALRAELEAKKTAASAPTRGNFMMASDLPSFQMPRLDQAIQKRSELLPDVNIDGGRAKDKSADALPDGVTFSASDFKKSKYAMSPSELSEYVAYLLEKNAAMMGAGTSPMAAMGAAKKVGLPGMSLPTPQGPSIANIAKPKGAGFGSGIAGAFKGSIGGTTPVDLGASSPGGNK